MAEAEVDEREYAEDEEGRKATIGRKIVSTERYRFAPKLTFALRGSLPVIPTENTAIGGAGGGGHDNKAGGGGRDRNREHMSGECVSRANGVVSGGKVRRRRSPRDANATRRNGEKERGDRWSLQR